MSVFKLTNGVGMGNELDGINRFFVFRSHDEP